jgi:hypothetical protein
MLSALLKGQEDKKRTVIVPPKDPIKLSAARDAVVFARLIGKTNASMQYQQTKQDLADIETYCQLRIYRDVIGPLWNTREHVMHGIVKQSEAVTEHDVRVYDKTHADIVATYASIAHMRTRLDTVDHVILASKNTTMTNVSGGGNAKDRLNSEKSEMDSDLDSNHDDEFFDTLAPTDNADIKVVTIRDFDILGDSDSDDGSVSSYDWQDIPGQQTCQNLRGSQMNARVQQNDNMETKEEEMEEFDEWTQVLPSNNNGMKSVVL